MPSCPNPECPHVKRLGKPAEYVAGVGSCSDCGSQLAEIDISIETKKTQGLSDFQKRVLYTLGMLAIFRMLTHVPAPGIYGEALDRYLAGRGGEFLWADLFGLQRITV